MTTYFEIYDTTTNEVIEHGGERFDNMQHEPTVVNQVEELKANGYSADYRPMVQDIDLAKRFFFEGLESVLLDVSECDEVTFDHIEEWLGDALRFIQVTPVLSDAMATFRESAKRMLDFKPTGVSGNEGQLTSETQESVDASDWTVEGIMNAGLRNSTDD